MKAPPIFSDLNRFCRFCCITGIVCQALTIGCTFLPWTRYLGESFSGLQPHPLTPMYDGRAGKMNLGVTLGLLFLLSLIFMAGSKRGLRLYSLLALSWSSAFSYWLIRLHNQTEVFKDQGLSYALVVSIGAAVAYLGLLVSFLWNDAPNPSGISL